MLCVMVRAVAAETSGDAGVGGEEPGSLRDDRRVIKEGWKRLRCRQSCCGERRSCLKGYREKGDQAMDENKIEIWVLCVELLASVASESAKPLQLGLFKDI